jgi:LuxR family quorum sensing-dependent transcriptional regulator
MSEAVVQNILETIETFDRIPTADGVIAALKMALAAAGRKYFCLNVFPQGSHTFAEAIMACELPPAWLDLYLQEDFATSDPALRQCKQAVLPFAYCDAPYDAAREPRAAEVVERARDFGLCNGMLIPIAGPKGCVGDMWVGAADGAPRPAECHAIHMLALHGFYKIQQLMHPAACAKARLSNREREILKWVAAGKTAWEIGEVLHISKRTVEWHVQQAAQKLGGKNRMQTVIIAVRDRLIEA